MHSAGTRLRLLPEDEYMHPLEEAVNFNESMYFNLFDHDQQIGGWFRLGNRPNEGHAEMSCCLYLPDGRVGFMYQRPALRHNDAFAAGGMQFEVVTPLQELRIHYDGSLCVLADPQQMEDPRKAFLSNPMRPCQVHLTVHALADAFGGEPVDADGHPLPQEPERAFARGHYEQHLRGAGEIRVGDEVYTLRGFGLRDHSWGPRYWQSIRWYRWLPLAFGEDFAMVLSVIAREGADPLHCGVVMDRDDQGALVQHVVAEIDLQSHYDERLQAVSQVARVHTESGRQYDLTGTALTTIPLRNRRRNDAGEQLHTRITEAMTRFECNGRTGYGMAEYLDQLLHDRPAGYPV